jgi:peptidoglycan/LPS O-acetylase OafA/YrhL
MNDPARAAGVAANYRPDVDGLRAIAVLCVVAYHAFPRKLPGGFIGVDIFFVISGFLITGLIFADLQRQRFTFRNFYIRRFRRIFPALITVLTAALIYGWFALAPDQYRELGRQAAAGAGFSANILFWLESGYFDVGAIDKPLLHLWSLGVEEQFYLAWPIIMVLAYKVSRRLLAVALAISIGSLIASLLLTRSHESAAFYLPITRFWELLLGAMLALVAGVPKLSAARPRQTSSVVAESLACVGVLLIAAGLIFINRSSSFPGWWALAPTVGTALAIASPHAWLNRKILSHPLAVGIGLISYPLYLWHWVLLSFAHTASYGDEPSKLARVLLVAAAFLLAWATYRLVELPIRFSPNRALMPRGLVAGIAVCAVLGLVVFTSDGAAFRYPAQIRPLAAAHYDRDKDYYTDIAYRGACFIDAAGSISDIASQCVDEPNETAPLVALWGDSHAASLYPGLRARASVDGFRLAQFTASACPPVLGVRTASRGKCAAFNDAVLQRLRLLKPDIAILEAHWALYQNEDRQAFDTVALQRTIRELTQLGIPRVIVMGSLPSWKIQQPRVSFVLWQQQHVVPTRSDQLLDARALTADRWVQETVAATAALFVSPLDLLCNHEGCLLSTDPRVPTPVAWDNDHLSVAGSRLLADRSLGAILGRRDSNSRIE